MSDNPYDSANSSYRFVSVDEFTPNSGVGWSSFGNVASCVYDQVAKTFTFTGVGAPGFSAPIAKIYILGPNAFRLRFNRSGNYSRDGSFAVVNKNLGQPTINVLQNDQVKLSVDLGGIRLDVLAAPFTVQVYRGGQLISSDVAQGLEYIPGTDPTKAAVANFKTIPANARYFGFGEKGGTTLDLLNNSLTFFNYDNFKYAGQAHDGGDGFKRVVPEFSDPGPLNTAEPLYNSIPFLIEDNPAPVSGAPYAYGLLLDNEGQTYFNLGQSSSYAGNMYGKYYFGALYGDLDYYFVAADDMTGVINQYTTLTGRPALVPLYVLGYHQGCYGYYSHAQVMSAVEYYRLAQIPLDGVHIDVDFQNNYRTFTASPEKFPGGGQPTFAALAALGVKASTNITGIVSINADENGQNTPYFALDQGTQLDVFIKDVRAEQPSPPPAPGYLIVNESYGTDTGVNPFQPKDSPLGTYGYYADLGRAANRAWWGTLYKDLLDAGLSMVWQDMTDPAVQPSVSDSMPYKTLPLNVMMFDETSGQMVPHAHVHNIFALQLVRATYEGLLALRPNQRPFIIARGGYSGIQRYAATWTGDSASDWNFLQVLIPEVLNFGLSGQPLAGADVGGFATSLATDGQAGTGPAGVTDPELLVRWTTMSAFFGWFRNHYDGYNKAYQEPYAYGEPISGYCRRYIEIRYKLLQYFYDALYEATQTGLPICRALCLTDRGDPEVYNHLNDQFMVGNDLLVAPVVVKGSTGRGVYLPAGSDWYAYQDATAPLIGPNSGGQTIGWYVPLDLVPVYVRAGTILPRRELEQYVGELTVNPLTFEIYPGPDRSHRVYLDDHLTTAATTNGAYRLVEVSQATTANARTVRVRRLYDQFAPPEPFYYVSFLKSPAPNAVTVGGVVLPRINAGSDNASADQLANSATNAYYVNASLQTTFVKVFDTSQDVSIALS